MRRHLPAGTVTFLFTDVEGSTRLLHELGAEPYAAALAEHRRLIRETCAREGGAEVDTQGDAFFFAFSTAPAALAAAQGATTVLKAGPIRVRIGLHTGTPLLTEEGYVGGDVHRAARIAAAGHGGQVLVSAATAALVDDHLLRDLGEHRFKDLAGPERVYQLGTGDFPPLKSLFRTNLPVPATPFLGRERELEEVVNLLGRDEVRLVTLTGPGGTGKSRLAIQSAAEIFESFPDGAWWISMAPLREARLVVSALAQPLQVEEQPGRDLAESVAARLEGLNALLLFDNAEHLLPDIAAEIARLRDVPGPKIVVTSRERLQLQGEHVYAVPTLTRDDGVELFLTRARTINAGFVGNGDVAELCDRLDNLPLALELAAARTVVFSPEQLLERLSQRLDLLKAGRDADPRQQTLRATIEWSYDLLDERERKLFRALSVFPGGCTYGSAEVVCNADADTLQSLLDKSLLRKREVQRYWMLETIRELAAEKLAEKDETAALRHRHAEHYIELARSANLDAEAEGVQRHDLVIPERDNMRAALAWALEHDEREFGLELCVALENYWATNAQAEGIEWITALLGDRSGLPDRLIARALRVMGGMSQPLGRPDDAEMFWEEALAIARRVDDRRQVAVLLHRLSLIAMVHQDWPRVRALAEESLAGSRAVGYRRGEPQALSSLAAATRAEGDLEGALELLGESRRLSEEVGFRWWLSGALAEIGDLSLELRRLEDARRLANEALALSAALADRKGVVYELSLLARITAEAGDREVAGMFWGAAEAENERVPVGRWIHGVVVPERVLAYANPEFERGRAAGRELSLEDAIELALGERETG